MHIRIKLLGFIFAGCCFTSCVNQKINVVQQVSQTALRQKYGTEHKNTFAYNPPISKPNDSQNNSIPKKKDSVKDVNDY